MYEEQVDCLGTDRKCVQIQGPSVHLSAWVKDVFLVLRHNSNAYGSVHISA